MGVVLKGLGYLGSALGLIAWLGGTAFVAFALTSAMGASPDHTTELAKLVVIIAGVVMAFVGSVILLRVTRHLVWFFVCFACGAFAALAGAGFSPANLSGDLSIFALGALAILGVSVIVLAITKRMVPFLVTLGLLGAAFAATTAVMGFRAGAPADGGAVTGEIQPDMAPPQASPMPPAATDNAPALPPPSASGQGAPAPAAPPNDEVAQMQAQKEAQAQERSDAEKVAAEQALREYAEEEARKSQTSGAGSAAGRPRTGATRGMRAPSGAITAPPQASPPPPAPVEAPAAAPTQPAPSAEITAPPPATSAEQAPVVADAKPSDFQTAELKFNKPDTMEIDVKYTVSATIAGALAEAQASLGNVGPTVSREVKITRKVRVELVASDFDIKKLSTVDTVLITPETSGQWSWEVTPRRLGGDRTMLLQVYGVIERDGVPQGETLIKTYEETIPVKVTPMAQVRLISQGIIDRWQPIAGALGVIGGIWVFLQKILAALTRRRKEEHA